ncbi:hypothetical protein L7F22_020507 [Adiantum nelumboides]|nr:hypothetical protein [Adiantum nelumboides]
MQRALEIIEQHNQSFLQVLITRTAQESKAPEQLVQEIENDLEDKEVDDKDDEDEEGGDDGEDDDDDDDDDKGFPKNDTWTLCDLPPGKKAISTKWVYKLKCKSDGEIDCYKARLVATNYAQQKGIDYKETFAPTCCMTIVHFLCALASHLDWDVHQSDTITAFLNGDIFEEVYVKQPCGFVKKGQEDKVCKCNKALYGLKQSPRAWYEKVDTHLVKQGFCNSPQ